MDSPSSVRVKVDAQGRMVLPRGWRDEVVSVPGEVLLRRTADGLLLSPAESPGVIGAGPDGLPLLRVGRPVRNAEVLTRIDEERASR